MSRRTLSPRMGGAVNADGSEEFRGGPVIPLIGPYVLDYRVVLMGSGGSPGELDGCRSRSFVHDASLDAPQVSAASFMSTESDSGMRF